MFKIVLVSLAASFLLLANSALSKSATYITVEEARINKAEQANKAMIQKFASELAYFESSLAQVQSVKMLETLLIDQGKSLFRDAVGAIQKEQSYDDRPLYWARLQMAELIRGNHVFRKLDSNTQSALMFAFELASRGVGQTEFTSKTDKKILITGFDPFFLDRNVEQSNPSGVAALTLDNKVISIAGHSAEIQALIVPVRFADFDQGMIETMLSEHFTSVDMIATISMGREHFDLERFPGLRRSAKAPGNLNVYTGANSEKPLFPFLKESLLNGPEFVEFSLPVKAMQQANGHYQINDNHNVETIEHGRVEAKSLTELAESTSVNGSGGGYLSNEISYRSILLRNQLNQALPVGHIHTPRIKAWKKAEVKAIVDQIEAMLKQAINVI